MAPTPVLYSVVKRGGPYCDGWACYSMPVPVIVAIVVGSVAFIAFVIALYCCVRITRNRRNKRMNGDYENEARARIAEPIVFNPNAY
jgi:hypothetical protein